MGLKRRLQWNFRVERPWLKWHFSQNPGQLSGILEAATCCEHLGKDRPKLAYEMFIRSVSVPGSKGLLVITP